MPTKSAVLDALSTVLDPEVGIDIVNLGLVYDVAIEGGAITITMTMTTAACPVTPWLVDTVQRTVARRVEGATDVHVELVWEPPWTPDRMTDDAKRQLGWA